MFMGSSFRMERKLKVGLRVYTNAGDVASGSRSSCVDSADPVSGFTRGCPFFCCCERVNLLLTVCFVVELGSKAWLKRS